ncbi:MAG TPA: glycosyltransferase family 4 protein [Armatimonadota bacterium]|nr:glycosyltransferase family 4 protein [Armatimonadota bacterium]
MRVAIINSIRAYGGGEKWVLRAAAGLRARGAAVTVICAPESDLERRCREASIESHPVLLRHDVSPSAVLGLAGALRKLAPQVAICCNERAARIGALSARLLPRQVPLVYRNGLEGSFKNRAHNRLLVNPRIARYVTNSVAVRDELLAFGWISSERVKVIYNGVDPAPVEGADPSGVREELGAGAEDLVALTAARMVPEKGHALLLDVAAELIPRFPRLQIWLAGEGPETEGLQARSEAPPLKGHVRFLGFRTDVPRLLRAADLLVHPSRREGAPNVVLEAMVAGLPVVGVAAPGTAELVREGQEGLLAPIGDRDGLRARLEAVLADEGLRRRLGEAGRQRARTEFTEERSADRWLALLEEVKADG